MFGSPWPTTMNEQTVLEANPDYWRLGMHAGRCTDRGGDDAIVDATRRARPDDGRTDQVRPSRGWPQAWVMRSSTIARQTMLRPAAKP